jgi:putative transposon-encoded protein
MVKTDPDWGVQLDVTGGFPLAVVGFGNGTAIDVPVVN